MTRGHSPASRLYLVCFFVTNVGVGGLTLATGLLLYERTGSAVAFGALVAFEFALGWLGQLIGGAVLDRVDVLRTAVLAGTLRGVAVVLGALSVLSTGSLLGFFAGFLLSALIRPLFRSASFALVPRIAPPDALPRVNSLRFGLLQVAQLAGLLLVSLLNGVFSPVSSVLAVGMVLLIGSAGLSRLRAVPGTDFSAVSTAGEQTVLRGSLRSLGELLRVARHPSVALHLLAGAMAPLIIAVLTVLVAPVNDVLGGGAAGIALLDGGATVGSLGAVLLTRRRQLNSLPGLALSALSVALAGFLLLAASTRLAVAVLAFVVLGLSAVLAATCFDSLLQQRSGPAFVGRAAIAQEVGVSVVAVALIPLAGPTTLSYGFGAAALVYALVLAAVLLLVAVGLRLHGDRLFTAPLAGPHGHPYAERTRS